MMREKSQQKPARNMPRARWQSLLKVSVMHIREKAADDDDDDGDYERENRETQIPTTTHGPKLWHRVYLMNLLATQLL